MLLPAYIYAAASCLQDELDVVMEPKPPLGIRCLLLSRATSRRRADCKEKNRKNATFARRTGLLTSHRLITTRMTSQNSANATNCTSFWIFSAWEYCSDFSSYPDSVTSCGSSCFSRFRYRGFILVFTFFIYASYHLSRKAISVVKVTRDLRSVAA